MIDFNGKKVCIVGFGREGKAAKDYIEKHYQPELVGVADSKDGPDYLNSINEYDVVVKSPGIPAADVPLKPEQIFTTPTQIFFDHCQNPIIGITGTKGKSTTAALIHHILSTNNHPAILLGNIGIPALAHLDEITPDQTVVMELSSHQLAELTTSPHIAVLLNIFPEHLDYYKTTEEYVEAKTHITTHQTPEDYLIYDADNNYASQIAATTKAQIIPFHTEFKEKSLVAATKVAKILGLSEEQITTAAATFKPLTHRLEVVAEKNGITFVDDVLATLPEAAIQAIKAYGERAGTIMLGGAPRHQHYDVLAQEVLNSSLNTAIFFPETGKQIREAIEAIPNHRDIKLFDANSMEEAIKFAFENTPPGTACLLSPASPSFGLFKDYEDKAQQFRIAIATYQG